MYCFVFPCVQVDALPRIPATYLIGIDDIDTSINNNIRGRLSALGPRLSRLLLVVAPGQFARNTYRIPPNTHHPLSCRCSPVVSHTPTPRHLFLFLTPYPQPQLDTRLSAITSDSCPEPALSASIQPHTDLSKGSARCRPGLWATGPQPYTVAVFTPDSGPQPRK